MKSKSLKKVSLSDANLLLTITIVVSVSYTHLTLPTT